MPRRLPSRKRRSIALDSGFPVTMFAIQHSASLSRVPLFVSSLPLLHHRAEVAEQVVRVVWPRGGFSVVLHAEQRQRLVAQAFDRLVVQVEVGQFDLVGVDGVWFDG